MPACCHGLVQPKPMDKQHATQLLFRWLPGLRERQADSSSSGGSDNNTVLRSCSEAGCSKHSQGIGSEDECAPRRSVGRGSSSSSSVCSG